MDGRRTYRIATKVEMHLWMIRKGLERFEGLGRHADDHGLLGFRPDCVSQTGMNVKRQGPAIWERHGYRERRRLCGSVLKEWLVRGRRCSRRRDSRRREQ